MTRLVGQKYFLVCLKWGMLFPGPSGEGSSIVKAEKMIFSLLIGTTKFVGVIKLDIDHKLSKCSTQKMRVA